MILPYCHGSSVEASQAMDEVAEKSRGEIPVELCTGEVPLVIAVRLPIPFIAVIVDLPLFISCISHFGKGAYTMQQSDKSKRKENQTICVSVFKSGESTTTKHEYTKKWIELINRMEKSKNANFCNT